jgi:hypothetical protein
MTTVFIIPYRNRKEELNIWITNMIPILDEQFNCHNMDYLDKPYKVMIIHQKDNKLFNRGAICNVGTLILKNEIQNLEEIKNITIVIHDVDIYLKNSEIIKYNTQKGEVKHPYGDRRPQLGGILGCLCICNLEDYLNIGGMPNYWGWGGEDVCLARRFLANGIKINENNFIERRTNKDIIDPDSAPSIKQRSFQQITDKRNLRECFKENHLKPVNSIMNCKYDLLSENYVEGFENVKNVKMFNILINII